uniref:Immunoglobulin V-set domain-containing protein n=1 Tax=Mastacembelus armatus TaxID=205130 RepID=A0A3Q3L2L0_9TELE
IYKLFNVLSLLFVSGWISVSAAESQTVKVQPGEEVNLLCPNMSKYDDLTFWFRLVNGTKMGCVSVMHETTHYVSYCDGFKNRPFEMSSNISTVFLKIKQVNLSDSGLYFCGFYINGRPTFSVTQKSDETTKLMGVILGGVTVFLFMVIFGLVVKIWKLQKANHEENNPQRSKVIPELNYGTVTFGPRARRREMETNEANETAAQGGTGASLSCCSYKIFTKEYREVCF